MWRRQIAGGVTEPSGDGATHAYISKGHGRPVRGWHGPLLFRGGRSGIPPPGDADLYPYLGLLDTGGI
jgi:hypothetical protein